MVADKQTAEKELVEGEVVRIGDRKFKVYNMGDMNDVLEILDKMSIEIHEVESFMDDETRMIEAMEEVQNYAQEILNMGTLPNDTLSLVEKIYNLAFRVWENLTIFHQFSGIDEVLEKCDYIDDYLIEKGVA